ncbi:Uncharacterized protein Adt_35787 [Abeliophyllum distichum]|uniref:Uncharacterized protein n=1 Tax=Abeliophyllum distichum TaxID=126358 RepID=A0ABD1QG00_9LAMI
MDGVEYDLNAVLNAIPLATDDEGPAKDPAPSKRRKMSDKGKGSVSGKELLNYCQCRERKQSREHLKDGPELVRSCALEPLRTGLSRRKVSSVNKTLAVYTRRDSMALACEDLERHLEHMELQEAELRKEEDEIDTLRSTLARAQEDAVSSYKASSEFSSCMHMYGAESMKASKSHQKVVG